MFNQFFKTAARFPLIAIALLVLSGCVAAPSVGVATPELKIGDHWTYERWSCAAIA